MRPIGSGLCVSLFTLSIALPACSKPPEDPAVLHRALGNDHARNADWAAAAQEYALSLQANPRDSKVWELKANAHLKLGQVPQAAESLVRRAEYTTTDPNAKAEAYRLVAGIYVQRQDFAEAEKAFIEASKLDPSDELSLSWLGEFASGRGGARSMADQPDPVWLSKAIAYYDKVIALNPDNLFAYVNKRIAITKYMVFEEQEKALADRLIYLERKDAFKMEAAKTRLNESTARLAEFEGEIAKLSKKISELVAAQKAQKRGSS
ncbi:MAG TPA: tetratricopeptide repeat protein [Myxococcaceae bacterium]|nr:tetratricopeptide repeat protein [Myxococcaceae bacterium]